MPKPSTPEESPDLATAASRRKRPKERELTIEEFLRSPGAVDKTQPGTVTQIMGHPKPRDAHASNPPP